MANTTLTAKNGFAEGLIMDFSPDNTSSNSLTSALNATLLTFNGNEMALQNDMGNGRVETAYLPEGYVPVGTCEFGDIIYIVSYNPIINKSQIGCFPSPERNLSTEEIGGMQQTLSASEFQELDNNIPTGKLKASSVKKVIINKSLNSGDKYIVYGQGLDKNSKTLTDYGNESYRYSDFPKLLRLHVAAIEDSGKINYLDSTVKWYDNGSTDKIKKHYFIQENSTNNNLEVDIDSYRSLISSAYSIFQSKVSGKLAILAELEKINGFSCTHNVYITDKVEKSGEKSGEKIYHTYLNVSWESDNPNINPKGLVLTKSQWINGETSVEYLVPTSEGQATKKNIELPITADTTGIQPNFIISSKYDLTNNIDYNQFKTVYSYTAQVDTFLGNYTSTDPNFLPRKATPVIENDLPKPGIYHINAFNYVKDDKGNWGYGFTTSDGSTKYLADDDNYSNVKLDDAFVHNYFSRDIIKKFFDLTLTSYLQSGNSKYYSNFSNLIYQYEICPAMPYGYLPEYTISNSIDFSKVGSGLINLSEWRYFNDGNVSTLTFGLEAYPEDNKGISKIALRFYDNNGLAAVLLIKDRNSYSGTFTEVITLGSNSNKNLSGKDVNGSIIKHRGNGPYETPTDGSWNQEDIKNMNQLTNELGVYVLHEGKYYENDSGILYPNLVYLVEIQVYYQSKNAIGEFDEDPAQDPVTFTRWFWTNNLFNDYYFNTRDYKDLKINLEFSVESAFQEIPGQFIQNKQNDADPLELLNNSYKDIEVPQQYYSLGYNKYSIEAKGGEDQPNLRMALVPSLTNNYNTFSFTREAPEQLTYHIREGKTWIQVEDPGQQSSENSSYIEYSNVIAPSKVEDGKVTLSKPNKVAYPINSDTLEDYVSWTDSLKDYFNLHILPESDKVVFNSTDVKENSVEYIDFNGNITNTVGFKHFTVTASHLYNIDNPDDLNYGIKLNLTGQFYSKLTTNNTLKNYTINAITYKPIISSVKDLEQYNIFPVVYHRDIGQPIDHTFKMFVFKTIYNIAYEDKDGYWSNGYGYTNFEDGSLIMAGESSNPSLPDDGSYQYSIAQIIQSAGVDMGIFSVLTATPRTDNGHHGTRNELKLCSSWKNGTNIKQDWLNFWGRSLNSDPTYLQYSTATAYEVHDSPHADAFTNQLIIKTADGIYLPLNAFARTMPNNTRKATQRFGYTYDTPTYKGLSGATEVCGFRSLAQIVASVLSIIYYKDPESTTVSMDVLNDVITNKPYSEIWKKDFVVNMDLTASKDTNTIRSMFNISGLNFKDYIDEVKNNSEVTIDNYNNVTIENTFNKHTVLIQFQHQLKYNVRHQESIYNTIGGSLINIESDISKKFGGKIISDTGNYKDVMYLDLQKNDLVSSEYIPVHKLLLTEDNGSYWEPQSGFNSSFQIELNDSSGVFEAHELLQYLVVNEGGKVYAKNKSEGVNIYKSVPSIDDWDQVLAAGFYRYHGMKYFEV